MVLLTASRQQLRASSRPTDSSQIDSVTACKPQILKASIKNKSWHVVLIARETRAAEFSTVMRAVNAQGRSCWHPTTDIRMLEALVEALAARLATAEELLARASIPR
jgi:hypothetical protein